MKDHSVAVIGLDALDLRLVERWAQDGLLPNFQRLLQQAYMGMVENPPGLEAGSVWPTFATGVMPDHHGQMEAAYKFDTATYEYRLMRKDEELVEPLWVTASRAGKRIAVIDFPYALLAENISGIQVVDWLTHVRTNPGGIASTPSEIADGILIDYGANPLDDPRRCPSNHFDVSTPAGIADFRDRLLQRVAWKTRHAAALLREDWDLFITVFHEAHDIGHMCWHVHDTDDERHDAQISARVGDPLRDIYRALDRAIGSIVDAVPPNTTLIFFSSHGMGPERTASGFLDEILMLLEQAYAGQGTVTGIDKLRTVYRSLVPKPLRDGLNRTSVIKGLYERNEKVRHVNRQFFELSANHATGGVRLNLAGRERNGRIRPGAEFNALCTRLSSDLQDIVNLDTDQPLVDSVTATRDLYAGPYQQHFPDLLVEWNKTGPIRRVQSPLFGTIESHTPRLRTGDHTFKFGFFLATGPGIHAGKLSHTARAVDLAPTLAALLGYSNARYQGTTIALGACQ